MNMECGVREGAENDARVRERGMGTVFCNDYA